LGCLHFSGLSDNRHAAQLSALGIHVAVGILDFRGVQGTNMECYVN
jgi:hypothetical protein